MTFDQLEIEGRSLPDDKLDDSIALLLRDPRAPALARLIRLQRESLVAILSAPNTAAAQAAPTMLAHLAGSIDSLLCLEMRFTEILQRDKAQ